MTFTTIILTEESIKSHGGLAVHAVSDQCPELAEDFLQLLLLQVEPGSSLDRELEEAAGSERRAVTRVPSCREREEIETQSSGTPDQTILPEL